MITLDPAAESTKSRRRTVSRTTKTKPEDKTKIGLYISTESARRLGIMATMEGIDRSTIVDGLIRDNLRKYVVQVRSPRSDDLTNPPEQVSAT